MAVEPLILPEIRQGSTISSTRGPGSEAPGALTTYFTTDPWLHGLSSSMKRVRHNYY